MTSTHPNLDTKRGDIRQRRVARLALVASSVWALGCGDPVVSKTRDSLGGEASGVRTGPTHRPGQPCTVCHDGGTAPEFSVAGTLFVSPTSTQPLVGGEVTITDANGAVAHVTSNCAGNFYLNASQFSPAYPFRVSIAYGGMTSTMTSLVHRDGSCASCHVNPPGPASAGHVYLPNLPTPAAGGTCN